jgi:signal peptidase I
MSNDLNKSVDGTKAKKVLSETSTKGDSHNFWGELIKFGLIALLVIIPIRAYIAQPFIVSGASMDPTFGSGDYLIIDEISYRFNNPKRGEVVVFRLPENKSRFLIKRIVGLPEETVEIRNGEVYIKNDLEEIKIEEDYILNKSFDDFNLSLETGEYFVMGDNRINSFDSRSWGALPEELIKGRAFLRLLPISKIDVFPGLIENL